MIRHRKGFERVYDLRDRVTPRALDYAAPDEKAMSFFARKTVAFRGLISEREWVNGFLGAFKQHINGAEAR